MNYISYLTNDDVAIICNLITGKAFKRIFKQNSHEFSKIKPGFRPNSISDKEAISLATRHINDLFIASFVNMTVENWLKGILDRFSSLKEANLSEEHALAEALADSVFCDNLYLYFKLTKTEVDDEYLIRLNDYVQGNNSSNSAKDEIVFDNSESLQLQIVNLTSQLTEYREKLEIEEALHASDIRVLQDKNTELRCQLEEIDQRIKKMQLEKKKIDAELFELRVRAVY